MIYLYICSRYVGGTDFTPTAAGEATIELEGSDQISIQAGAYNKYFRVFIRFLICQEPQIVNWSSVEILYSCCIILL